jgi:hypothetical protein
MKNLVCLYWTPGSCGDLIQSLLITTKMFSGLAKEYVLDHNGRANPVVDDYIKKLFPSKENSWFNRIWEEKDLENLKKISKEKTFIIGTHQQAQLDFLKNNLGNEITTMGITYSKSLFPLIIKNFSKKVAPYDKNTIELMSGKKNIKLVNFMIEHKIFDAYFLDQQFKFFDFTIPIPEFNDREYDINIELEDIYNNNLSNLKSMLDDSSFNMFDSWYQRQDNLYKFKYSSNQRYVDCIGYNHKATISMDEEIKFSPLDIILIKHYFLKNKINHQIPKSNGELVKIFENLH